MVKSSNTYASPMFNPKPEGFRIEISNSTALASRCEPFQHNNNRWGFGLEFGLFVFKPGLLFCLSLFFWSFHSCATENKLWKDKH